MKNILGILVFLMGYCPIYAQETFVKLLDDPDDENFTIRSIHKSDGRLFAVSNGICNSTKECGKVQEINTNGDVIWEKKLPWLDLSSRSTMILNDTIVMAGNHTPKNQEFYFHYLSLDGDSLFTTAFSPPTDTMYRLFVQSVVEYYDRYVVGAIINTSTSQTNTMFEISKSLGIDSVRVVSTTDRTAFLSHIKHGRENKLITGEALEYADGRDIKVFRKYDKDLNITWEHTTPSSSGSILISNNVIEHPDGGVVFYDENTENNLDFDKYLYHIKKDSTLGWKVTMAQNIIGNARVYGLLLSSDNYIYGSGRWQEDKQYTGLDYKTILAPMIFKMDLDGNLIWRRVLVQEDSILFNVNTPGIVYTLHEMDNGDILGGGRLGSFNLKNMLVRISPDGCIDGNCNEYIELVDGVLSAEDPPRAEAGKLGLYPTIITEEKRLTIIGLDTYQTYRSRIVTPTGVAIPLDDFTPNSSEWALELPQLTSGLHFLVIEKDSGLKSLPFIVD